MSGTYKLVTLVGTSPVSYEQAIENALQDTSATLRHLSWFEVQEMRGSVVDGKVGEFQIKLQAGFRVDKS